MVVLFFETCLSVECPPLSVTLESVSQQFH